MRLVEAGYQHLTDAVDNTVVASNIDGEVRESSESLLSDNGVVDEIFSELAGVGKGLSLDSCERGSGDTGCRDVSSDDAVVEDVGGDGSEVLFVSFNGGVSGSKDSEGASSLECGGNTSGCETGREKTEVVVSLKFSLFFSNSDTVGSPDLSWSFKTSKSINDVGVEYSGCSADRERGEGSTRSGGEGEDGELHFDII
jgi:hypothetical protein